MDGLLRQTHLSHPFGNESALILLYHRSFSSPLSCSFYPADTEGGRQGGRNQRERGRVGDKDEKEAGDEGVVESRGEGLGREREREGAAEVYLSLQSEAPCQQPG